MHGIWRTLYYRDHSSYFLALHILRMTSKVIVHVTVGTYIEQQIKEAGLHGLGDCNVRSATSSNNFNNRPIFKSEANPCHPKDEHHHVLIITFVEKIKNCVAPELCVSFLPKNKFYLKQATWLK